MKSIKITYILKNMSEYFYNNLANTEPCNIDKFCRAAMIEGKRNTTLREDVDFNIHLKSGKLVNYSHTLESRKGYKLLTLLITY